MKNILISLAILYVVYRIQSWAFKLFLIKGELSKRALRNALLWGALASPILCVAVSSLFENIVQGSAQQQGLHSVLFAPFYEEIIKGIAPFAAIFLLDKINGRKLLVIGAFSGIGFFISETFLGMIGAALRSSDALAYELTMRTIVLWLLHPVSTALTGAGLGMAARSSNKLFMAMIGGFGFLCGFAVHFANNAVGFSISRGSRVDQSEFFGFHLSIFIVLLIIARVRIRLTVKEQTSSGVL